MGQPRSKPQTGPRATAGKDDDNTAKIVVDGISYRLGDLTLGELEELEEHIGLPMDMISYGSAKVIAFVVYLVRRRDDPNYSLKDARNIRIEEVGSEDGEENTVAEVGPDPTQEDPAAE